MASPDEWARSEGDDEGGGEEGIEFVELGEGDFAGGGSLRGLDNQLLREWRAEDGKHSFRDYVWTGRNLLAKIERTPAAGSPGWSEETRHAAVDHLGSVRLWTDAGGANLPGFIYYPFGKQLNGTVDDEQMRFTGHERDLWNTTSSNDDLDYMHARHYNPQLGRFLQIDPLAGSVSAPQSLNRYAYVASNPINYTDPTGMLMNAWDCGYNEDPPHTSTIAGGVQVNTTWVVFGCSGGGQSPQLTDRGYGWGGSPGRRGTPTGSPNPTPPPPPPVPPPPPPPPPPNDTPILCNHSTNEYIVIPEAPAGGNPRPQLVVEGRSFWEGGFEGVIPAADTSSPYKVNTGSSLSIFQGGRDGRGIMDRRGGPTGWWPDVLSPSSFVDAAPGWKPSSFYERNPGWAPGSASEYPRAGRPLRDSKGRCTP